MCARWQRASSGSYQAETGTLMLVTSKAQGWVGDPVVDVAVASAGVGDLVQPRPADQAPGRLPSSRRALVNCAFCFCWDTLFADHPPRREEGQPPPSWPRAIRAVRAWLSLDRVATLVAGMVEHAPRRQLQALINSVGTGGGLHLYLPN